MAWYPEEQWEMISDSMDKKRTAASAFKQRTHCGRGGSVKFPSDFLSKKELKAMNGECVSYRLNAPLSWDEFKELPNDLKASYIRSLREKYGVPDKYLSEMFGVSQCQFGLYIHDLKLEYVGHKDCWDKEAFLAWSTGADPELVKENDISEAEVTDIEYEWRPIKWDEFKMLSDENKIAYIEWIRKTFKASNKYIGEMMGVHFTTLAKAISGLGIGLGKGSKLGVSDFAKDEFYAWANGECRVKIDIPAEEATGEVVEEVVETPTAVNTPEVTEKQSEKSTENSTCANEKIAAVPKSGALSFESNADQALNMLAMIIGTNKVKLAVQWEIIND